jgi:PII-like signaling protein
MKSLFLKPLYQEIIDAAQQEGILNAVAHHTHYGYSGKGKTQRNNTEIPNPSLNLCVELIGNRDQLETFCRKHGELLKNKIVVYKHMEHWEIGEHKFHVVDADEKDLDADLPKDQ